MQLLPTLVSACGHLLPVVGVYLERLHVSFACILEAQMWASLRTAARAKLAVEQIFWDPPIRHAGNMSELAETALPKQCVKTGEGRRRKISREFSLLYYIIFVICVFYFFP